MAHPVNVAAERLAKRRPVNLPRLHKMETMTAGEFAWWVVIWWFFMGPAACLAMLGL